MEIRTRRSWSLLVDALILAGLLAVTYAATTATATPLGDGPAPVLQSIQLIPDESSVLTFGIDLRGLPLLRR